MYVHAWLKRTNVQRPPCIHIMARMRFILANVCVVCLPRRAFSSTVMDARFCAHSRCGDGGVVHLTECVLFIDEQHIQVVSMLRQRSVYVLLCAAYAFMCVCTRVLGERSEAAGRNCTYDAHIHAARGLRLTAPHC